MREVLTSQTETGQIDLKISAGITLQGLTSFGSSSRRQPTRAKLSCSRCVLSEVDEGDSVGEPEARFATILGLEDF